MSDRGPNLLSAWQVACHEALAIDVLGDVYEIMAVSDWKTKSISSSLEDENMIKCSFLVSFI